MDNQDRRKTRRLQPFGMLCYRRMMKIRWTYKVSEEDVLKRVSSGRDIILDIIKRGNSLIGHLLRLEGWIEWGGESAQG